MTSPDGADDSRSMRERMLAGGLYLAADAAGTVVGAGSVVTRDLPLGVLAAGVAARVLRPLTAG